MNKYDFIVLINMYRLIPAYFIVHNLPDKEDMHLDINRWIMLDKLAGNKKRSVALLLIRKKEFRNLMAYRIKKESYIAYVVFSFLFPMMDTLYINTENIGGGLYIQHGFSTIISAKSIGKNCYINQQVTIGYEGVDAPIIGDGVRVCAGAKVVGRCSVGNDAIIGANAVVVKNVPPSVTVGGVPAIIIRYHDRIDENE